MSNNDIKIVTAKKGVDFIGVKIDGKNVNVHVPQAFRYDPNNMSANMPAIIQLLRSIEIAKTIKEINIEVASGEDEGHYWSIDSYLWIINDYISNGFYYPKEKVYVTNGNGKIDWKKTIRNIPILSNGNIIYSNIVTSKIIDNNSKITHVYRHCLDLALKRIGWVFNYNFKIDYIKSMSIKEMKHIVKNELSTTFDDMKRLRFKHLLKIIDESNDTITNSIKQTYGIENYYYVFEKMIDRMFGNISDEQRKKYNPPTFWVFENHSDKNNSPLEPDTIHNRNEDNKKYTYIIDAKLYKYGCSYEFKDLPGSQSIQKQITYGDYVKNKVEKGSDVLVRNIFVLPYNSNNDRILTYFGYASSSWRDENIVQDHDYIFSFLIDFNYVLMNHSEQPKLQKEMFQIVESKLYDIKRPQHSSLNHTDKNNAVN